MKSLVLFLFLIEHMFCIFVRIVSLSEKYQIEYSCIICDYLLPLERRFRDSQIVIITNFVLVSSVGINRVVCITQEIVYRQTLKRYLL